jgi:hydroxypyruvate isomerase
VPGDREADAFLTALGDAGVSLVSLNFAAGDMAAGERGLASRPDCAAAFRDNVQACVAIAERAGCSLLNALYGNRADGVGHTVQENLAIKNLALAGREASRIGATVLVEALNSFENPRYPLTSSGAALAVIDRVRAEAGVAGLAFLADLYHLARMGEDLAGLIAAQAGRFGHVQIADAPGRGAPGTGELAFGPLLRQLAASGYRGWVGLEYKPSDPADSSASFGWLRG